MPGVELQLKKISKNWAPRVNRTCLRIISKIAQKDVRFQFAFLTQSTDQNLPFKIQNIQLGKNFGIEEQHLYSKFESGKDEFYQSDNRSIPVMPLAGAIWGLSPRRPYSSPSSSGQSIFRQNRKPDFQSECDQPTKLRKTAPTTSLILSLMIGTTARQITINFDPNRQISELVQTIQSRYASVLKSEIKLLFKFCPLDLSKKLNQVKDLSKYFQLSLLIIQGVVDASEWQVIFHSN